MMKRKLMKRKLIAILLIAAMGLSVTACGGAKKTVHCDNCNAEILVDADSNITEDWLLYCDKCNEELGIDEKIIEMINEN